MSLLSMYFFHLLLSLSPPRSFTLSLSLTFFPLSPLHRSLSPHSFPFLSLPPCLSIISSSFPRSPSPLPPRPSPLFFTLISLPLFLSLSLLLYLSPSSSRPTSLSHLPLLPLSPFHSLSFFPLLSFSFSLSPIAPSTPLPLFPVG